MLIAGASLNQTPLDWSNNTTNIIKAIVEAKKKKVAILCLPELCITGYGCEDMFLYPWVEQQALEEVYKILSYTKNITVALGLPIHYKNCIYNTICLVSNKEILGFQPKRKLANYGVHYEKRWFTPWIGGVKKISISNRKYQFGDYTYKVGEIIIGFEICEEAWDKERIAVKLVENHVNLILNPSASHFSLNKGKIRDEMVVASSEKFNCAYVYANLLGNEAGSIIYDGDVIIAEKGNLLASGTRFSKQNLSLTTAEINATTSSKTSLVIKNDSKERQFTNATTLGLFDYLRKSKSRRFVLSLSGGCDSSSIVVLIAEMVKITIKEIGVNTFLNKINREDLINKVSTAKDIIKHVLITAYQGSENSSTATLESAKILANSVGATFYHWDINQPVDYAIETIEKQLKRKLTWDQDNITLQNIQARSRSPLIWVLANSTNAILLTTSNRSEASVGYTTMDGDSSGSLAPIAGIDKKFIIEWLKWAEKTLGYEKLSYTNKLRPSAELKPLEDNQTDEKDLMPYDFLLHIEKLFIKEKKSPLEIFNQLSQDLETKIAIEYISKFFKLWSRNQWKRERMAPSFHLDEYNIEPRSWFRFPILSSGFAKELKMLQQISDKS